MKHTKTKLAILCLAATTLCSAVAAQQSSPFESYSQTLACSFEYATLSSSNCNYSQMYSSEPASALTPMEYRYNKRGRNYLSLIKASACLDIRHSHIVFDGGVLGFRFRWFGFDLFDFGIQPTNDKKSMAIYRPSLSVYIPAGSVISIRLYGGPYYSTSGLYNKFWNEAATIGEYGTIVGISMGLWNNIELFFENRIEAEGDKLENSSAMCIGLRLSAGMSWKHDNK